MIGPKHFLRISRPDRSTACTCPSGDGSLRWPCPEHPPRETCEDCQGAGVTGNVYPGSMFQPPEPEYCSSCDGSGWWVNG